MSCYSRTQISDVYQEEDFFTQLYNRSLLTAFPPDDIAGLADDVLDALEKDTTIRSEHRAAITTRLKFQQCFLQATQDALESMPEAVKLAWAQLQEFVQPVKDTHSLGKLVPEAISSKIQRKVASSNPPRPVVELEFTAAIDFVSRLCKDGILVEGVSECSDLGAAVVRISFSAYVELTEVRTLCFTSRLNIHNQQSICAASYNG